MKTNDNMLTIKASALAAYLGIAADEVTRQLCDTYGMTTFDADGGEYAIATDGEADEAAEIAIKDSAWAFRASWLAEQTELPQECFEAMQGKCEGCNDAVLKLIDKTCGMESFVQSAVSADGRGHFLSGYDGDEAEFTHAGERFYIYRTN